MCDLGAALRTEMADQGAVLRTEMHELNDDAKRHMDIVSASLRDDIRIVAEGVISLSTKIDFLRR